MNPLIHVNLRAMKCIVLLSNLYVMSQYSFICGVCTFITNMTLCHPRSITRLIIRESAAIYSGDMKNRSVVWLLVLVLLRGMAA